MSRGRQSFRQADISRAMKAAQAAGVEVARVEIDPDGKICIVIGKPVDRSADRNCKNEWDEVIRGKN
jgi:hypothetical protein